MGRTIFWTYAIQAGGLILFGWTFANLWSHAFAGATWQALLNLIECAAQWTCLAVLSEVRIRLGGRWL